MAFSTLRKYSGSHAMDPTVKASKGSGSIPSGGSVSTTQPTGNATNDAAALGGMGAVGAGLLGKIAYNNSKEDLMNSAGISGNDVMGGLEFANHEEYPNTPGVMDIIKNIPSSLENSVTGWWNQLIG